MPCAWSSELRDHVEDGIASRGFRPSLRRLGRSCASWVLARRLGSVRSEPWRQLVWGLSCVVVLVGSSVASSVTRTVIAVGEAAIGAGGEQVAFEDARRAALREAVEQGVGVLVSSSTRMHNFEIVADDILAESVGYVCEYEVLERGETDDGTYRVALEAVVDLGGLHRDMAALKLALHEAGSPRLLCVGTEIATQGGRQQEHKWGVLQTALASSLESAGRGVFDMVASPAEGDLPDAWGSADTAMTADVAVRRGFDIVIQGVARVEEVDVPIPFSGARLPTTGLQSAMGRVEIQAFWADTRELITTVSGLGRGADTAFAAASATAIHRAVESVLEQLLEGLAAGVRTRAYGDRDLQMVVRAPAAELHQFERDFPDRMQAVVALIPRSYESGEAVYDVRARGAAFEIARELSAGRMPGVDVEIVEVSASALILHLTGSAP